MPFGFYKDLIEEIKALGFAYERQAKGSHEQWLNAETDVTVTVPHNLYSRHTANGILKKAGGKKKF
jgi:predicted RNA binding protein YcfA (HicA-like mRNA interferase family)